MKISIVTVTFNSEKTIQDTFDSVLSQTYRPLQYIVVDGLSTDSTMPIVKGYAERFAKAGIEYIYRSEKDDGISDAFNKGIRQAEGDIIGIINSDDLLAENALEILARAYEDDIFIYYGNCIIFNDSSSDRYIAKPKTDLERLRWGMGVYHPSCFVKRSAYEQFGLFKTDLKYCMDRELLLRFYVNGAPFKYINESLACYREGGVNQKYYKKNLKEGTRISIDYGMSIPKAYSLMYWKLLKHRIWKLVQVVGAEKYIHKKV